MPTKHQCVLIHIWTKGYVGTQWNRFKPSSKMFFYRSKAVLLLWIIYLISVLFLVCFSARQLINALWSSAGKGLTSWLSSVMSNCDVVTFPLVSWVRCGTWLYQFLIFALFLTLSIRLSVRPSFRRYNGGVYMGFRDTEYLPFFLMGYGINSFIKLYLKSFK